MGIEPVEQDLNPDFRESCPVLESELAPDHKQVDSSGSISAQLVFSIESYGNRKAEAGKRYNVRRKLRGAFLSPER